MSLSLPEYSRLLNILNQTKLQVEKPSLYQFLKDFLAFVSKFDSSVIDEFQNQLDASTKQVLTADDPLPEFEIWRKLVAGTHIDLDSTSDKNQLIINATGIELQFLPLSIGGNLIMTMNDTDFEGMVIPWESSE
jgi:hypothetical protein